VDDGDTSPVPTWTVGELHEAINGLLVHVFGDEVWIEGEVRNLKRSANSHVYFDLVEAGRDGDTSRPMLAVTLFSKERQEVNRHLIDQGGAVRMGDGVRVRIRGRLNIYGARSSLQLRMSWIDPAFTLGVMGQERDRVLALLSAEGLLGVNAAVPMPPVPLHIALVTSSGSAAHADALDELRRAGPGFRISVLDARTQGAEAERSIVAALRAAAVLRADVVLLVRGGGARTDLAAFDTEAVARAIAASPLPVVTGIGHEIDRTVADEVAHAAHKTPTAAAAAVAERARRFTHDLDLLVAQLPAATRGRLVRAAAQLDASAHRAGRAASHHLVAAGRELDHLARRTAVAAPRLLDDSERRVQGLAARARAHDPSTALARGWSITRDDSGRVLRSATRVLPGATLHTTLADGTVRSVVPEPSSPEPSSPEEPT
jgi:exodeoxyribonuclease VII large subunit